MKALHGGKAKHETSDAPKIAVLRRGGMRPQASVYPAERRATRDLLRRRWPLTRNRAELLAHVQNPTSQYNWPEIGKQWAYKANRDGVAERCPDPAVQKSVEVDLALIDADAQLLRDVEWTIVQTAKQPHAQTLYRRPSVPGLGKMLSLVVLDERPDLTRFPRGQDVASSGRLGNWATASAGTRSGTSGAKLGTASLKGAFSEAAVRFLRHTPAGQQYLARREHNHGTGNALTLIAHTLARAVYDMRKRETACAMQTCLPG